MRELSLTTGEVALVDDEDYEMLRQYRWSLSTGYAATPRKKNTPHYLMHRMILNAPKGVQVDHVNGNRLDNRRENLRLATYTENARNSRYAKEGNPKYASKYKGVRQQTSGNWQAMITVDYKQINLGTYENEMDAAIAYDRAAVEYFGEFAASNFPIEETKDKVLVNRRLNEDRPILTGQRFGKWLVLGQSEKRHESRVLWECRCDCGNTRLRKTNELVHGKSKSCGCYKRTKGE